MIALIVLIYPLPAWANEPPLFAFDPAYHTLASPHDPWTYASGAGPSGGWGIAAAAANPASLVFGPGFSVSYSWIDGYETFRNAAVGFPLMGSWRAGISFSFLPDRMAISNSDYGYAPEVVSSRRSQYSVRGTLAWRVASNCGMGINLGRLTTSNQTVVATNFTPRDTVRVDQNEWFMDLGWRVDGIAKRLSLPCTNDPATSEGPYLWKRGFSLAMALSAYKFIDRFPKPAVVGVSALPTRLSAAVSWHLISLADAHFSLNTTYIAWINDVRGGYDVTGRFLFNVATWGVGIAGEVMKGIELGVSAWQGYANGQQHVSWFVAAGPRAARAVISSGYELRVHERTEYGPSENAVRLYLRFLVPVGRTPPPPDPDVDVWPGVP